MEQKFSQELRNQIKAYFQVRCALAISDDEADEYLDSMADLYMAFSRLSEKDNFQSLSG
jgi:hypothetical protein